MMVKLCVVAVVVFFPVIFIVIASTEIHLRLSFSRLICGRRKAGREKMSKDLSFIECGKSAVQLIFIGINH